MIRRAFAWGRTRTARASRRRGACPTISSANSRRRRPTRTPRLPRRTPPSAGPEALLALLAILRGTAVAPGQIESRVHEPDMRKRLREIADKALCPRIVLLREEPHVV